MFNQLHRTYGDYTFPIEEIGIKKGRDPCDLSLLSNVLAESLEPAVTLASKIATTRAWSLGFGFVDRQRAATKLR